MWWKEYLSNLFYYEAINSVDNICNFSVWKGTFTYIYCRLHIWTIAYKETLNVLLKKIMTQLEFTISKLKPQKSHGFISYSCVKQHEMLSTKICSSPSTSWRHRDRTSKNNVIFISKWYSDIWDYTIDKKHHPIWIINKMHNSVGKFFIKKKKEKEKTDRNYVFLLSGKKFKI